MPDVGAPAPLAPCHCSPGQQMTAGTRRRSHRLPSDHSPLPATRQDGWRGERCPVSSAQHRHDGHRALKYRATPSRV